MVAFMSDFYTYDRWGICDVLGKHDHRHNMKTSVTDAFHFFFFYHWYPLFRQVFHSLFSVPVLVSFHVHNHQPPLTVAASSLHSLHGACWSLGHIHKQGWQRMIKLESHLLGKLTSIRPVLPPSYISTISISPTLMLIHHPLVSLTCSFTVRVLFITNLSPSALDFQSSSFSLYSQWSLSICHHHFESSEKVICCSMQLFVLPPFQAKLAFRLASFSTDNLRTGNSSVSLFD